MKILLLGEYSGVHNNLRKVLVDHNYSVLLVNSGDGSKSLYADTYIKYEYISSKNSKIDKMLKLYYLILTYSGFKGVLQIFRYYKDVKNMKGYDVVQLINPLFLSDYGHIVNLLIFLYLKNNNNKIFLSALGDDYYWVKYCLNKNFDHSIFDRLSIKTIKSYSHPLQYIYGFLGPFSNKYMVKNVNAVIPGLYDYYEAYKHLDNCTEIVPIIMPLNDKVKKEHCGFPIKIFHGWQIGRENTKGNDIFDKAIKRIKANYGDKVEYRVVSGVSYEEYIKTFEDSHIFIDQCYSQDCGVNALLGMSKGKVVFSGFDKKVKEYYRLKYNPLINSLPNEDSIYKNIEYFILNPSKVQDYSTKAVKFIKEFHDPFYIMKKYEKIWKYF